MRDVVKATGAAALLGGVIMLAGCQSSKVMDNRPYIPAASGDGAPVAQTAAPASASEVKDLPVEPAPAAQAAPAGQQTFPRFDEADYEPVKPAHKPAAKGGTYVVKKGDTVGQIAYAHGVRTADVMAANNLDEKKARHLRIGQKLVIPAGGKAVRRGAPKAAPKAGKGKKAPAAPAAADDANFYVVKKGDNIPKIARKLHVKAADLMAANNLDEAATRRLQVGQKLVIPGRAAAPAAASPAVPKPEQPSTADQPSAGETTTPPEAPAGETATPKPAPAGETATPAEAPAGETAAPAGDKVDDSGIASSRVDNIKAPITVREYLKEKNLTLDVFRKLNSNTFSRFQAKGDDVLDWVILPDTTIFIPTAPAAEPAP